MLCSLNFAETEYSLILFFFMNSVTGDTLIIDLQIG